MLIAQAVSLLPGHMTDQPFLWQSVKERELELLGYLPKQKFLSRDASFFFLLMGNRELPPSNFNSAKEDRAMEMVEPHGERNFSS